MELQCQFKIQNFTFHKNGRNESGYTCRVKNVTYNPELNTIVIIGDHQEFMTNADVRGLSVDSVRNLKRIPYGLTKVFPNLIYLQIRRCGLTSLTKRDLIGLEHLQGLWLPENDIVSLEADVFENCQGLKYLCLLKNKLKFISSDIFKPLKNLTDVNFSENTCIDKNYLGGNKDQLNAMIEEILKKCQKTVNGNEIDESKLEIISLKKEIFQLKNQCAALENKVNELELQKNVNPGILSRIDLLEQVISDMQIRMTMMEDLDLNLKVISSSN
ncbi:leucine-rich repeat-containing protein 15-like [Chironomus tepperi]|uniref:leucine-rich repeat-containing protein 15-like n=1 Tax=Chironomus tepperi TaxID=113505 RepID=UPI00391F9F3B